MAARRSRRFGTWAELREAVRLTARERLVKWTGPVFPEMVGYFEGAEREYQEATEATVALESKILAAVQQIARAQQSLLNACWDAKRYAPDGFARRGTQSKIVQWAATTTDIDLRVAVGADICGLVWSLPKTPTLLGRCIHDVYVERCFHVPPSTKFTALLAIDRGYELDAKNPSELTIGEVIRRVETAVRNKITSERERLTYELEVTSDHASSSTSLREWREEIGRVLSALGGPVPVPTYPNVSDQD